MQDLPVVTGCNAARTAVPHRQRPQRAPFALRSHLSTHNDLDCDTVRIENAPGPETKDRSAATLGPRSNPLRGTDSLGDRPALIDPKSPRLFGIARVRSLAGLAN
jgi:hypothetical protein